MFGPSALTRIAFVLMMACATAEPSVPPGSSGVEAVVVRVIDGDTIRVLLPNGAEESVRLIGIDASERGEPLADEATAFLARLIQGETVVLVSDQSDRDRYDRLLRYVFVDDLFVNEELVRSGLAYARRYPPDTAMAERLEQAEAEARRLGVGLWDIATDARQHLSRSA
jgi:micrococcal nuclease